MLRPTHTRTIFPDAKIRAVVLGSRMRMMTAAKRCGHGGEEEVVNRQEKWVFEDSTCEYVKVHTSWTDVHGSSSYLGVVLRIPSMQSNLLEVQLGVEVHSGDNVLKDRHHP